jgi:hypothetical protein
MTILKPIQPLRFPQWFAKRRSTITAMVCVYFGLSGALTLLLVPFGFYLAFTEFPDQLLVAIANLAIGLALALVMLLGARRVWRFDRSGLIWIGAVLALSMIEWLWKKPTTGSVVFLLLSLGAVTIAWFDLEPVGHGRLK